jgi:serine/threonine protein kinase
VSGFGCFSKCFARKLNLPKHFMEIEKEPNGINFIREIGRGNYSIISRFEWHIDHKSIDTQAMKLMFCDNDDLKSGRADCFLNEIFCSAQTFTRKKIVAFKNIEEGAAKEIKEVLRFGACMKESLGNMQAFMRQSIVNKPSIEMIKVISKQFILALKSVHDNGVMHRDVKPENFLLFYTEENPLKIELVDFSLSTFSKKSKTSEVITLWWRPMEVLIKKVEYDNKVDIWSLGMIFLQLITGRQLFNNIHTEPKIIENLIYFFGYPSQQDWPEFHKIFPNLEKEGKVPGKYLRYGLYGNEFEMFKEFMPVLEKCLNLVASKRPSCDELLEMDFFKGTESLTISKADEDWIHGAYHQCISKSRESLGRNEHSYEIKYPCFYSKEDFLVLENKTFDIDKNIEKAIVRIEAIKKDFLLPLFSMFRVKGCPKEQEPILAHTKVMLLSIFVKSSDVPIKSGILLICCLYISGVLTKDRHPTLFDICSGINENIETFFGECYSYLPLIIQACDSSPFIPLEKIVKNKHFDWIYENE